MARFRYELLLAVAAPYLNLEGGVMSSSAYERGFAAGCRERTHAYVAGYDAGVRDVQERLRAVLTEEFHPGKRAVEDGGVDLIEAMPLTMLELSIKTYNVLARSGIRSIGEFLLRTEQQLLEERNFGAKRLREVQAASAQYGRQLDSNHPRHTWSRGTSPGPGLQASSLRLRAFFLSHWAKPSARRKPARFTQAIPNSSQMFGIFGFLGLCWVAFTSSEITVSPRAMANAITSRSPR